MKTLQKLLNKLGTRFTISLKSFPITLLYLLSLSIYSCYLLVVESFEINEQFIVISLVLGTLCSLLISLYKNKKYLLNTILSLILTITSYIYLEDDAYHYLFILAVAILLLTAIIYLLFKNNHKGKLFGYLICEAIYSLALCTILFAGISIILAAIQYLIYEITDFYKVIFSAFFIIYIFVATSLFISSFIHEDKKIEVSNIYKTIFHKAGLVLYYLLLIVLYVYLLKILFTLKMPVGQLNWFASFALLFNIFFYISGQFDNSKLMSFHIKYGGLVLIPIFIIQAIAIYIRVNAYGLTSLRYLSIAFNIIGLSFIISSIIKKKLFIYPIFVVLVLLVFASPANIIDVPAYNQEKILEKVLIKNNMLDGTRIIPKNNITSEDKETIHSTYEYLAFCESNKIKLQLLDTFDETFGFDYYLENKDGYCYYSMVENFNFEIGMYKYVEVIDGYSDNSLIYDIDVSNKLLELRDTYGTYGTLVGENQTFNTNNDEPYFSFSLIVDENTKLIFDYLAFSIIDDNIEYISYHAYKLSK